MEPTSELSTAPVFTPPIENDSPEVLRLKAELAAAKSELEVKNRELNAIRSGAGENAWRTTTTKPVWLFEVKPFRSDLPQLKPFQGHFVDESEAIRCFWVENKGAKGHNKQGHLINLDSTTVEVRAICLDPKREEGVRARYLEKVPAHLVPVLN